MKNALLLRELANEKDSKPPGATIDSVGSVQKAGAVTIDVWYGGTQKFGKKGNPQQWVNILGNVSPSTNLDTLAYVLNSKPVRALSFNGNKRLANEGDFNIELDINELKGGTNSIQIRATEKDGTVTRKNISFTYTKGSVWPENYTADWSSSSRIFDTAQVVDGKWAIEDGKLVVKEVGYDRLVAIGEMEHPEGAPTVWTDYEVTVPITVKAIDDAGFEGVSGGPAVGFFMRWQGHSLKDDEQPRILVDRVGAIGRYRWLEKDGQEGLELTGDGWRKPLNTSKMWELNTTYILKMSVQSFPESTKAYYRLKFWKQGETEPGAWDIEGSSGEDNSPSGSVVLNAHHVDAEFGDVQIRRLSDLDFQLNTNVNGSGAVSVNPVQNSYSYGEKVTVTAIPAEGYYLKDWTGDLPNPGTVNPLEFDITQDVSVTANFEPVVGGTLTVNVEGMGQVTKDPDKESYEGGEAVTLTAVPEAGHLFKEWSGDLSGTLNPATITMNGDVTITAIFEEADVISPVSDDFNRCELYTDLWTFVNPSGVGSVSVEPAESDMLITVPAAPTMTMWMDARDAPRIMQDTLDQDFTVEIKFESIPDQNNQFQGLLVEQDEDNWIRFDILNKNGVKKLFAGATTDGTSQAIWNETIDVGDAAEIYMRVSRLGDTWTQRYSTDGTNWQSPLSFDQPLAVVSSGIFAGNENGAAAPDFVARADYFKNTAFPSGITGYLLSYDIIGAGTVALDPQPDENGRYGCTVDGPLEVTLQATPEESFVEWTGDVTSSETTVTLTMDGDKSVTASFVEEYTLTSTVIGDGIVTVSPDQEKYEAGTEVTLTAVAGQDYYFAGWSGDASGTSNPLIVTMDSDKSITAIFAKATVFMPGVMSP
jgi:regulation of enolase protein 1 (concanavalin A-like superfamily)